MDDLFRAIREECSSAIWSKGVQLARSDAVTGDQISDAEVVLRIHNRDGAISPTVRLYPEDEDWSCNCGSKIDPCEHVAAAIIAVRRAHERGEKLPSSSVGAGKVVYKFSRSGDSLSFGRFISNQDQEVELTTSLAAITSGRVEGPSLSATKEDMEIEAALGQTLSGILESKVLKSVLSLLSEVEEVFLDSNKITVSSKQIGMKIVIEEESGMLQFSAEQDKEITEVFKNGVALCTGTLRPLSVPALTPLEEEIVRRGKSFSKRELAEVATEIIPALKQKFEVEEKTAKLPERSFAKPRVEVLLASKGEILTASSCIVYGDPVVARVEGDRLKLVGDKAPVRDIAEELRLKDELSRDLSIELEVKAVFAGSEAVRFTHELKRFKGDVTGDGLDSFRLLSPLTPTLEIMSDDFSLSFSSSETEEREALADPSRVMSAWHNGESLVPLLGGGWAAIPSDWLSQFGSKVIDLIAAREGREKLPKSALPTLAAFCDDIGLEAPEDLTRLREELESFEKIKRHENPKDMLATLRGYQQKGVDWLAFLKGMQLGGMLADDMGLGKTIQALSVIDGRTLIVAPTSVMHNWIKEIDRFRPTLKASLYHGPNRKIDPASKVTITTYAILRINIEELSAIFWDMVILDEAQNIKNPDSQATQAAYRLDANTRITLSGTPVENRLEDLWSQFNFLNPGLLGSRRHFQARYEKPISAGDEDAASLLRQKIKPFFLRRRKAEVAPELPARIETILNVELSESERSVYNSILAATQKSVIEKVHQGGSVMDALEALLRLRQACCHSGLVPGQSSAVSSKLSVLCESIEKAVSGGHKALVFSQWTSFLDLLEPFLKSQGTNFLRLDGSTSNRSQIVDEFQAEDGPPVLIMSLKAGGVGINLTAADYVYITDPWWNPMAEDQASDRAHRIGQTKPVVIHRLVALDTVEEKILDLQSKKRALAEAASSDSVMADGSHALTRDDLLSLLQ